MFRKFLLSFATGIAVIAAAAPVSYEVSLLPEGNIQPVGVTAGFTGKIIRGDDVPEDAVILYEEFVDGIRQRYGNIEFGEELKLERCLDRPGWYDVRLRILDKKSNRDIPIASLNRRPIGKGFMIAPEKILPSAEKPADFDEFWDSRRAMLDKVPVKELERKKVDLPAEQAQTIQAFDVKVACAGSVPVSGILTMPVNAAPQSLPAIVLYHGAGVHSAGIEAVYGRKAIAFQVNANGNENLRERAYYDELRKGKLNRYWLSGKNDREKYHFHDMFLRVMRSLDYVKTLPEWNGKILVVSGGSQGGAQAVVAAAMDPQVTMMIADVPAMCDHSGFLMTPPRFHGWPMLYRDNRDPETVKCAAYYDMVNFAERIKCESFVSVGGLDHVCAPCGIAAMYNRIPAEKKYFRVHATGEHILPQLDPEFRRSMVERIFAHLAGR